MTDMCQEGITGRGDSLLTTYHPSSQVLPHHKLKKVISGCFSNWNEILGKMGNQARELA